MRHAADTASWPRTRTGRRRPRWHRTYYLLAMFDVLVVGLGLALNHQLISMYSGSVKTNELWEQRLDEYLDLSELAAAVNAPGNNVFDSRKVVTESKRADTALDRFQTRLFELRSKLPQLEPEQARTLGRDLHAVDLAMRKMITEAHQIFSYFRAGQAGLAGTRMAAMDRKYHGVNLALGELRKDVGTIQRGLFADQEARAASLQRFEYMIAGFVLLMITCAMLYGKKIKRELESAEVERDRHIAELEATRSELSAARDDLECRVEERTSELAQANAALSAENEERVQTLRLLQQANSRLERQARRLHESNRDLQDFAYVASHDLQEPLRKILAFSDRLESRSADTLDETAREYLARMRNASTRMQTLIQDLLVFSRVQTKGSTRQVADLGAVVTGVLADLEVAIEESGATVQIGELPTIEADPLQMRQLFQNLIGNALKFRRPDAPPEITVSATVAPVRAIGHAGGGDVRQCTITVADNGIGFEAAYSDKIFTVFQRLHGLGTYEGSGVGLAVCRRIAERHAGSISAEATPGHGAVFTVVLPIAQPPDEEAFDEPEFRDHALAS